MHRSPEAILSSPPPFFGGFYRTVLHLDGRGSPQQIVDARANARRIVLTHTSDGTPRILFVESDTSTTTAIVLKGQTTRVESGRTTSNLGYQINASYDAHNFLTQIYMEHLMIRTNGEGNNPTYYVMQLRATTAEEPMKITDAFYRKGVWVTSTSFPNHEILETDPVTYPLQARITGIWKATLAGEHLAVQLKPKGDDVYLTVGTPRGRNIDPLVTLAISLRFPVDYAQRGDLTDPTLEFFFTHQPSIGTRLIEDPSA